MARLALIAMAALAVCLASNHREAPIAALGKKGGATELFAVATHAAGKATLVLCADPLLDPAKPAPFDPAVTYELKLDTDGDSKEDVTFRVLFSGGLYRIAMLRGAAVTDLGSGLAVGRTHALAHGVRVFSGMVEDPASVKFGKAGPAAARSGVNAIAIEAPAARAAGVWAFARAR